MWGASRLSPSSDLITPRYFLRVGSHQLCSAWYRSTARITNAFAPMVTAERLKRFQSFWNTARSTTTCVCLLVSTSAVPNQTQQVVDKRGDEQGRGRLRGGGGLSSNGVQTTSLTSCKCAALFIQPRTYNSMLVLSPSAVEMLHSVCTSSSLLCSPDSLTPSRQKQCSASKLLTIRES